jgi:hypothetical protein
LEAILSIEHGLITPFLHPAVLADLDHTMLPTEEGLYLRTIDWWNQEDFLALTGDELAEMLPNEHDYTLGGRVTLAEIVNGLPTREDCMRAFADPAVERALVEVCKLEIPLVTLDIQHLDRAMSSGVFDKNRAPEFEAVRRALGQQLNVAQLQLMRDLERASGYAHWGFLHRAFSAWMASAEPPTPEVENSK